MLKMSVKLKSKGKTLIYFIFLFCFLIKTLGNKYINCCIFRRMMVKDSSLSAVIFIFKMTHPCSVRYSSSYPVANFPQLKLAATECEAVEELKSGVLTEWFGNRCMVSCYVQNQSIRAGLP